MIVETFLKRVRFCILVRYSRHIVFDKIGKEGQKRLNKSKVTIIGLGGLGSVVSLYLAGAGIENLRIVDHDKVGLEDLQRQVLYNEKDIGKNKVSVAAKRLSERNSLTRIEAKAEKFNERNAESLIRGSDLVMDCMDNAESRLLLNRKCFEMGIPFVHAAVVRDCGWVSFMSPKETACVQCIIPPAAKPKSSKEVGILNSAPGVVGTIQATEAIKYLSGFGENLKNELLFIDLSSNDFRKIRLKKNCNICSNHQ
jgi:molybdopterin/thiamine biosynthesis adenylyltransferase